MFLMEVVLRAPYAHKLNLSSDSAIKRARLQKSDFFQKLSLKQFVIKCYETILYTSMN